MVRARWFGKHSYNAEEDGDPLGGDDQPVRVPECPQNPPSDELHAELVKSIDREGQLDAMGVTCPIKDLSDTSCHSCPIRRRDERDPMKALCDIGIEQERLVTLLAARKFDDTAG